ncbi:hypothetical protein [Microcoleus sp.]|uniref:hypothetical protein n=1 Tax=Microcoleus sp. TaxID=44472 RepID=UPI003592EEEC
MYYTESYVIDADRHFGCFSGILLFWAIALGVAGSNPAAAIAKTRRIKRVL